MTNQLAWLLLQPGFCIPLQEKTAEIEACDTYQVFDENANLYFEETMAYYNMTDPLAQSNLSQAMWEEANLKHAINGKMFCWNDGFTIPEGKRFVPWHHHIQHTRSPHVATSMPGRCHDIFGVRPSMTHAATAA